MSKSLELIVHERCTCDLDPEPHYAGEEGLKLWYVEDMAREKHLTDEELAAEYWCAESESWRAFSIDHQESQRIEAFAAVFGRFATLPHHDEVAA